MPTYFFDLHTGVRLVRDPVGTELASEQAARDHANAVARELMQHRESKVRHWRLRVHRDGRDPEFEVLFASVDQSMDVLETDLRKSAESVISSIGSLGEAVTDLRLTLRQVKATMAKAEAKIHLAAIDGARL